jgi:hypothetical protein
MPPASPPAPQAVLPARKTRLPRAQHVPRPKEPTRWEKFAASTGITKKKRGGKVWDDGAKGGPGGGGTPAEADGEWRPRHGAKRARDGHDWLIPAKKTDDPTKDLFEERDLKKKSRVIANELSHVHNQARASKREDARTGHSSGGGGGSGLLDGPAIQAGPAGGPKPKKWVVKKAAAAAAKAGLGAGEAPIPAGIAHMRFDEGRADGLYDNGKHARPAPGAATLTGKREDKSVKAERLKMAQVSTASMGRVSVDGGRAGGRGEEAAAPAAPTHTPHARTHRALFRPPPSPTAV